MFIAGCQQPEPVDNLNITYVFNQDAYWQHDVLKGVDLYRQLHTNHHHCEENSRSILWQLKTEGGATTPEQTLFLIRKAINQDRSKLLMTSVGSQSAVPAASYAEDSKIPLMVLLATADSLYKDKKYIRTFSSSDRQLVSGLINQIFTEPENSRAIAFYDATNDYSENMARLFKQQVKGVANKKVPIIPLIPGSENLQVALKTAGPQNADFIFLPLFENFLQETGKELRKLNKQAIFLGTDSWNLYQLAADPAFDHSLLVHQWHPDFAKQLDETRLFTQAFIQRFGSLPKGAETVGYDAISLALQAACKAKTVSPVYIAKEIRYSGHFAGAQGRYFLQPDGGLVKTMALIQFQQGKAQLKAILNKDI